MMTDGLNIVANIEIDGIEVDDEVVHKLLAKELTDDEIDELVFEGISGNRMMLRIIAATATVM